VKRVSGRELRIKFPLETLIGCLHDPANVQHWHVYFEYICWKFAGRLLDRVNTPLRCQRKRILNNKDPSHTTHCNSNVPAQINRDLSCFHWEKSYSRLVIAMDIRLQKKFNMAYVLPFSSYHFCKTNQLLLPCIRDLLPVLCNCIA